MKDMGLKGSDAFFGVASGFELRLSADTWKYFGVQYEYATTRLLA
jgi:hypothetical protein